MKRFLKHLFLSSLATLFLVSCGSKNENIENTDTLDFSNIGLCGLFF